MKAEPHTKPPSHEGNPSRRSAPTNSLLSASAPQCEWPLCVALLVPARLALQAGFGRLPGQRPQARVPFSSFRSRLAFSLVELLVVMAIIGMMVGLSVLAIQGMRAPAVQFAAEQVMSGLSLARQVAITKNTYAALLIADQTNVGFPTNGPYRHWSVVYSNKGADTWTIAKNWEELPNGAIFYEIRGASGGGSYNRLTINPFSINPGGVVPSANFVSGNSTDDFTITLGATATIPCIRFRGDGVADNANTLTGMAIRIGAGSVLGGNATLTSTNQYFFIETDGNVGRIRMRSPESYQ